MNCLMIGIFGFGQNAVRSSIGQFIAVGDAVETADKFRDHPKLDEIFRLCFGEQQAFFVGSMISCFSAVKADGAFS